MKNSMVRATILTVAGFATFMLLATTAERAQTAPKYEPPKIISTADASYPINSIASGAVVLEVDLNGRGSIDSVKVLRDVPSLTAPAVAAVKKWKFSPAKLDGYPVSSIFPVAFSFVPPSTGPRI